MVILKRKIALYVPQFSYDSPGKSKTSHLKILEGKRAHLLEPCPLFMSYRGAIKGVPKKKNSLKGDFLAQGPLKRLLSINPEYLSSHYKNMGVRKKN